MGFLLILGASILKQNKTVIFLSIFPNSTWLWGSPWSGHIQEATDRCFPLMLMFLSLSSSPPHSLSLESIKEKKYLKIQRKMGKWCRIIKRRIFSDLKCE